MKQFTLLFFTFIFIACQTNNTKDKIKKVPNDWFFKQRAFPYPSIDAELHLAFQKSKNEFTSNQRSPNAFNQAWIPIGPSDEGGRLTDIEMWPNDKNTILIGSASGGIFLSENQGNSFEPIFDDAMSLSIGDIALAPSNEQRIYVGTGEANAGGGSLAYDGIGVYRSDDKGNSWSHIGLEKVGSIGKIVVDPDNEDVLYVAAMGTLFGNNEDRGIYKSEDGGISWEKVLYINNATGGIDLAIDPSNPNNVYAALWQRERSVSELNYGGPHSGIYKSEDGGDTWSELNNGLPTIDKGRLAFAIA
ncbi:MAG: hypothetical protein AAGK97_06015, partial [Bacteroidota bacterium]